MKTFLLLFGAGAGLVSAGYWFWSAFAVVTREQEVARRIKVAEKKGEKPNLAGVSFDGVDLMASMRKQSRINGSAALLAGIAILAQTASAFVD